MILLQPDPGIQNIAYDLGPFWMLVAIVAGTLIMWVIASLHRR